MIVALAEAREKMWGSPHVCTPEWTRTTDPRLRRPLLYPAELRARARTFSDLSHALRRVHGSFCGALS